MDSGDVVFVYFLVFVFFVENLEDADGLFAKFIAVVADAGDAVVSNVFYSFEVIDVLNECGFNYFWTGVSSVGPLIF